MIIKAPKEQIKEVSILIDEINKFYENDVKDIPTVHFDKHLYSPVATFKKGKKYQQIKTIPVKLNEGETKFIIHFKEYLVKQPDKFKDVEIFLLRNLSQKGIGFFLESSSFFPDFILWVVKGEKQYIYFLDPKGIRMMTNFNHPKVLFCTNQIKEVNDYLNKKIIAKKKKIEIELSAFILSITNYDEIKKNWGSAETTKEDFNKNNILFIEENKDYLNSLMGMFI
jgi:hypothetical protein